MAFICHAHEIHWPRAFEGGYVTCHKAVSACRSGQWSGIDPTVEPIGLTAHPRREGGLPSVKDLAGQLLFDGNESTFM